MDQGAVIELVRQYEHLYNKKLKDCKNKLARENAWKTISSIMGYPREEVESTWNPLRNRFTSERRKIRCTPSGSGARAEWRHYDAMLFLNEHVAIGKTVGNIVKPNLWATPIVSSQESLMDEESQELLETDVDELMDQMSSQSIPSQSASTPQSISLQSQPSTSSHSVSSPSQQQQQHKSNIQEMRQNKRKKSGTQDIEKSLVATLVTIENVFKPSDDENNEDMLFGRSIGESLKMIKNRKIKARVKEILSVFEKYEEEQ